MNHRILAGPGGGLPPVPSASTLGGFASSAVAPPRPSSSASLRHRILFYKSIMNVNETEIGIGTCTSFAYFGCHAFTKSERGRELKRGGVIILTKAVVAIIVRTLMTTVLDHLNKCSIRLWDKKRKERKREGEYEKENTRRIMIIRESRIG